MKHRIQIKASELSIIENITQKLLSPFNPDDKTIKTGELLLEELSVILSENLDDNTPVCVSTHKHMGKICLEIKTEAENNFLQDFSPKTEQEEAIRPEKSGKSNVGDESPAPRKTPRPDTSQESAEDLQKREVEEKIRNVILKSYSSLIAVKYNPRRKTMKIRLNLGLKKRKRDYSGELENFYSASKGSPPSTGRQLRFIFRQHAFAFFVSFLIKAGRSAPMVVIPIASSNIIDIVAYRGGIVENLSTFIANLGIATASLLMNILFSYLEAVYFRSLTRGIGADLRNAMVWKLQKLSLSYHGRTQTGVITNKMMNNIELLEVSIQHLFGHFSIIMTYVIAAITVTLVYSPAMSLFYVLFIPISMFLTYTFRKPISKVNRALRKNMEGASAAVTEMLGMVETTRAHGLEKNEIERMSGYVENIHSTGRRLDVVSEVFSSISWVNLQFFQLSTLAFSAYLASKNIISIGAIALFQSYFSATVTRLSTFMNTIPQISKGIEACSSIAEVLSADDDERKGTKVPHRFLGCIEFKNVSFKYSKNSRNILNGFSLRIPQGTSLALVGPSGSGKSTLINLILGFSMPTTGTVEVDGVNLEEMDLTRYRKHVAFVPQHTVLFSGTLLENLTYGTPYVPVSRVMELLDAVGLGGYVRSLPGGIFSYVEESGTNLSGGQKQRLALVRALLRDASIIILDEPTSALDRENELRVREILRKINGTCTIVMIAHRLDTIKNFDNIVVLEEGKIAEQGTYKDLSTHNGAFQRLREGIAAQPNEKKETEAAESQNETPAHL